MFSSSTAELVDLQITSPNVDLTDYPCSGPPSGAGTCAQMTSNNNLRVSAPAQSGFGEIEFNLANNFWGCNFNFGNSFCGVKIRQGIAHLIDKARFVTDQGDLAGHTSPIDDPEPPYEGLPAANPCMWDVNATQSGSDCKVGAQGGTAFHFNQASGIPGYPWMQSYNDLDFCVAALDVITAINPLGIAPVQAPVGFWTMPPSSWTLSSSTNCQLMMNDQTKTTISNNPVNLYIRTDNLALMALGNGLAADICNLFTGSYSETCYFPNTNEEVLSITPGPIDAFNGYGTGTSSPRTDWWMYTSGVAVQGADLFEPQNSERFLIRDPFDTSLYYLFNSRFVSGVSSIKCTSGSGNTCSPGPCSAESVFTQVTADYMYVCSPSYDSITGQMENAPCLTAPSGDPMPGQSNNGPGGDCSGTSQLSAYSAAVQAEDLFGQSEFTIPIYTPANQYGYLNNWSRVINSMGGGIPGYFTWLNTYNPAPTQTRTIRQGASQPSNSVNPYVAYSFWDMMVVGNIYDTLLATNPLSDAQAFNWMIYSFIVENNATVISQGGYTPPPHTRCGEHDGGNGARTARFRHKRQFCGSLRPSRSHGCTNSPRKMVVK